MKYTIKPYIQFHTALKYVVKKNWKRQQQDLAKEVGISTGHLSDILRNAKQAGHDTQVAIAEACGFKYENFLALGRKIHQGENVDHLIDMASNAASGLKDCDLNGAWKASGKLAEEDYELLEMAFEIIQSDSIFSRALKAEISALYDALKTKDKLEKQNGRISQLEKWIEKMNKDQKI